MAPHDPDFPEEFNFSAEEELREAEFEESDSGNKARQLVRCWRCDKSFDHHLDRCPFCEAENRDVARQFSASGPQARDRSQPNSPAIVKTVWAFAAFAATSILFAVAAVIPGDEEAIGTSEWAKTALTGITIIEVVDTAIVLISLWLITVRPQWPQVTSRTSAWLLAVPLFAAALAVNMGYHFVLQNVFQLPNPDATLADFPELLPWCILVICIQPAIIEELFFRHLALGAALEVMRPASAIFISSLLFAMAHLGTPLSIPYLTLLGAILGYLRFKSGSLWLPITFHFIHNLVVLQIP